MAGGLELYDPWGLFQPRPVYDSMIVTSAEVSHGDPSLRGTQRSRSTLCFPLTFPQEPLSDSPHACLLWFTNHSKKQHSFWSVKITFLISWLLKSFCETKQLMMVMIVTFLWDQVT
uniref:Uncharacterized protein n=1 Tax=Hypotaenidia okinawae TaxID=2861861 RepID=A0A6G1RHL3_9GRUI